MSFPFNVPRTRRRNRSPGQVAVEKYMIRPLKDFRGKWTESNQSYYESFRNLMSQPQEPAPVQESNAFRQGYFQQMETFAQRADLYNYRALVEKAQAREPRESPNAEDIEVAQEIIDLVSRSASPELVPIDHPIAGLAQQLAEPLLPEPDNAQVDNHDDINEQPVHENVPAQQPAPVPVILAPAPDVQDPVPQNPPVPLGDIFKIGSSALFLVWQFFTTWYVYQKMLTYADVSWSEGVLAVLASFWKFIGCAVSMPIQFSFIGMNLEFLVRKISPIIMRQCPRRREKFWAETQSPDRVQRRREDYEKNKHLIDEAECPLCWEVSEKTTVWFPCLHTTCYDCSKQDYFSSVNSECPVCRTVIDDRVVVDGKPFTAKFQVGNEMKDWVINWCAGDTPAAGN